MEPAGRPSQDPPTREAQERLRRELGERILTLCSELEASEAKAAKLHRECERLRHESDRMVLIHDRGQEEIDRLRADRDRLQEDFRTENDRLRHEQDRLALLLDQRLEEQRLVRSDLERVRSDRDRLRTELHLLKEQRTEWLEHEARRGWLTRIRQRLRGKRT